MEYYKLFSDITLWYVSAKAIFKIIHNAWNRNYKKCIANVAEAGADAVFFNVVGEILFNVALHQL